ncbi:MAG: hypothetical protein ACHQ7M_20715, partial [Chloroflexota bacterium]
SAAAPQPVNLVGRWFVGEGVDPLGAGVLQRGVELSNGAGELVAPRCAVVDHLLALLLVTGDGSQFVAEVAFRSHSLLHALLAKGDLGLGRGDGFMVVSSPPAAAGVIEVRLAGDERLLGVVSGPEQVRQLTAELLPLVAAVWGDLGVELVQLGGGGRAGVSELVDAEGKGVIGADTRRDHLSPVVVELFVESAEVVSPPPFGPRESLQVVRVSLQGCYPASNLVSSVFGILGLVPVKREFVL